MIYTPDTNLVIARIKNYDSIHTKATKYLITLPPVDVRLLKEVYLESCEILKNKTDRAIQEIFFTIKIYLTTKGCDLTALTRDDVNPIISQTLTKIGIRNEGFYKDIGKNLTAIFDTGQNPFLAMPVLTNSIMRSELNVLDQVFYLVESGNVLLEVANAQDQKLRLEIEDELSKVKDSFFSVDKNERDRRIAGELTVVCKCHSDEKIQFALFDKAFQKGLAEDMVCKLLSKYHNGNLEVIRPFE